LWYRVGADAVVVIHLLFICFVVGGVFLAWRWSWVVWVHIPAVIHGALVEFAGFTCPLTLLENDLRRRAGQAGARSCSSLEEPPGRTGHRLSATKTRS
jgi:Protein of Unknown function (DUF2784)